MQLCFTDYLFLQQVGSDVYSQSYPGGLDINDGYFAQVRIGLQKLLTYKIEEKNQRQNW